jgi:intracellular septation protein
MYKSSSDDDQRSKSADTWVTFKVFGVMPLTFIFAVLQYPPLTKHDASRDDEPSR